MEAYLVRKHPLEFKSCVTWVLSDSEIVPYKKSSKMTVINVEPVLACEDATGYCQDLKKLLDIGQASLDIYADFTLTSCLSAPGKIEIRDGGPGIGVFGRLKKLFGEEHVRISFRGYLKDHIKTVEAYSFPFSSEGLKILNFGNDVHGCTIGQVEFPNSFWAPWSLGGKGFVGAMSVKVILSDHAFCTMYGETITNTERNKRDLAILNDGIGNDFTIVGANGEEVKCQKSFLAACSPFFKAKIINGLEDASASNTLQVPEMSESSVRALVAYAYAWDVSEASRSCDVAVELYVAGHQYDISGLEEAMEKFLFVKPMKWFNVDSAVKILLFVKSFYEENDRKRYLAKKASRVLKWHSKFAPQQLWDSLVFQEAHQNPRSGMELTAMISSLIIDD